MKSLKLIVNMKFDKYKHSTAQHQHCTLRLADRQTDRQSSTNVQILSNFYWLLSDCSKTMVFQMDQSIIDVILFWILFSSWNRQINSSYCNCNQCIRSVVLFFAEFSCSNDAFHFPNVPFVSFFFCWNNETKEGHHFCPLSALEK